MKLSVFKQTDQSGKMSKESFVKKNYNEEWLYIQNWAAELNLSDITFVEKVYLCLNNLPNIPHCQNRTCDNTVKFLSLSRGYRKYCCTRCMSSDPDIQLKKEQNSIRKWGTSHPQKNRLVKQKATDTNLKKYGSVSPMQNSEVKLRSQETLLKNWGVTNPAKSQEILSKRIESFKGSDFKETFKKTSLRKYNAEHPWSNSDIHKKSVIATSTKKMEKTISTIKNKLEKKYSKYLFECINFDKKEISIICPGGHSFKIAKHTFDERFNYGTELCTTCKPVWSGISGLELQLTDFLNTYPISIKTKTRDVIKPLELDLFVEDRKVAIEFNGLYWHSSANKVKEYHIDKWQRCNDLGIKIINVWEDDWIYKKDIVKSNLLYSLGLIKTKIPARKCKIKEISSKDSQNFLDQNHLQGSCKSGIKIGLYYCDELISVMTFSKPRLPLSSKNSEDGIWELTRFANKINLVVQGAASKLLSYFEENYKPSKIETYSDNAIFDGSLYETLGFEFSHVTKPGYWYLVDGKRSYRFNWRKSLLVKQGADPSKTEEQIMSEWGYPRIYNAGNKKWIKSFSKIP